MATTLTHPLGSFVLLLNRLTLGLYVAAAGAGQLFRIFSGEFVKNSFIHLRPTWLPPVLDRPLDYVIPAAAIICGILMALGLFTRIAAIGITIVAAIVTEALVEHHGLSGGGTVWVHHNFVLITLALLLAMVGPGLWSLDVIYRRKAWS